ncbi:PEP-CTERM sorting domain-containing protein [Luteitalea sp.]|uniref:PEP-CTERM sorting domain-containing protein n=1 Tax=Luteitalea sp. TaxID=2004800 RepID=UPI0025BCE77E|nr:PEP-CTERM sorting domain-containing protein [Luteitalea sp.]
MSARLRAFAGAPLALVVTLLTAAPAHASAIYAYTGNPFTSVGLAGPTAPADPYTTADRVTGFIELASPLPAGLSPLTPLAPVAFSFFDGVNTITEANATFASFEVETNNVGAIVNWLVRVSANAAVVGGGTRQSILTYNSVALVQDGALDGRCGPDSLVGGCALYGDPSYSQTASNAGAPGVWALRTSVPEPSSMLLIGVALAGVAARRRATRAH